MKETQLIDYLDGTLPEKERLQVEQYLLEHPEVLEGLGDLSQGLHRLSAPQPSARMRQQFYAQLADWKAEERKQQKGTGFAQWWKMLWQQQWLPQQWLPKMAWGALLLIGGIWIGYQLQGNQSVNKLEAMTAEMQQMQKAIMLSMIEQNTATKRIKAVNMAASLIDADQKVVEVLVHTLNNDDNVNVRIVAAETLIGYMDMPTVRMSLIASLPNQTSPLVQLTLSDALLQLQDEQALDALKKLATDQNTNESIREQVQKGLSKITTDL